MGPPGGPTDSWRIYNGSLYINFFPAVMEEFFEPSKVSSHIAAADERWAGMWGAAEKVGPFNYLCGGYPTQEVSLHSSYTHLACHSSYTHCTKRLIHLSRSFHSVRLLGAREQARGARLLWQEATADTTHRRRRRQ